MKEVERLDCWTAASTASSTVTCHCGGDGEGAEGGRGEPSQSARAARLKAVSPAIMIRRGQPGVLSRLGGAQPRSRLRGPTLGRCPGQHPRAVTVLSVDRLPAGVRAGGPPLAAGGHESHDVRPRQSDCDRRQLQSKPPCLLWRACPGHHDTLQTQSDCPSFVGGWFAKTYGVSGQTRQRCTLTQARVHARRVCQRTVNNADSAQEA